jgi:tripartite-type tricarboxylate transporter receptor subunit TctC
MTRPLPLLARLGAAAAALALAAPASAQADAFPNRPITMIVPYAPGGSGELLGRVLARRMGEALGQNVIVDLKPGAGGNIGAEFVARAPADGYTFLFAASSLASSVSLLKLNFDPLKSLVPVAGVTAIPNLMVTAADSPYKSAAEFFDAVRKSPGKLTYGSSGLGTGSHLAGELLAGLHGLSMTHIPYKGSGAVYPDLISGRVDTLFDVMGSALGQVKGGRVKPLGITSAKRSPALPDVPTLAEQGVKDYEMVTWFGFFAPTGVPPAAIEKLNAATAKALDTPDVKERLQQLGAEAVPTGAAEFARYYMADVNRWAELVKSGKLAPLQ